MFDLSAGTGALYPKRENYSGTAMPPLAQLRFMKSDKKPYFSADSGDRHLLYLLASIDPVGNPDSTMWLSFRTPGAIR
jgi:hypothetical protein